MDDSTLIPLISLPPLPLTITLAPTFILTRCTRTRCKTSLRRSCVFSSRCATPNLCHWAREGLDPSSPCGTPRQVCHDKNGLFFTGDTCQTIARGVGFRFEELTTMFHHVRARQLSELAAAGWQLDDLPRHQRVRVPEINKLAIKRVACASNTGAMRTYSRTSHALHLDTHVSSAPLPARLTCPPAVPPASYRTHNGILGAASEVVSLLLHLFPHSVGIHLHLLHPLTVNSHPLPHLQALAPPPPHTHTLPWPGRRAREGPRPF